MARIHRLIFMLLGLLFGSGGSAWAEVRLPALFSDHMIVQAGRPIPLWGWASPGESVTVSWAGKVLRATAGADGRWRMQLPAVEAGSSPAFSVKGKNRITINDVLAGEVWLASGQSNMARVVSAAGHFEEEKAVADHPRIRMFTVAKRPAKTPQEDCTGRWVVCSPETVGDFSGTAYFFARDLNATLDVPVGVINASVGATPIESWISLEKQRAWPGFDTYVQTRQCEREAIDESATKAGGAGKKADASRRRAVFEAPAVLYNAMIAPVIPYAVRGFIWYQGESNATAQCAPFYEEQMKMLIEDWRSRWHGELPFGWVQLANFRGRSYSDWPTVREAQRHCLNLSKTGMAVTIDIGESQDIHPHNKQEIGHRLALWAFRDVYSLDMVASGPLPVDYSVEGTTVKVRFDHVAGGLVAREGELTGFEIAGRDGVWEEARASIQGDTVVVTMPGAATPVAVRYGWANDPVCNLSNREGLPASPFWLGEGGCSHFSLHNRGGPGD